MKKLIIPIILFFAISVHAATLLQFQQSVIAGRRAAENVACNTANDSVQWQPNGSDGSSYDYRVYNCDKVVIGANITVTGYSGKVADHSGADTGNVVFKVFNQDTTTGGACGNDCPDLTSPVSGSTTTNSTSVLPDYPVWTETEHDLASTYSLPAGTYYLCTYEDSGADFYTLKNTTSSGDRWCRSEDGSTITYCYNNESFYLRLLGCEE